MLYNENVNVNSELLGGIKMKKKEDLDTFYRKLKELVKSEENTTDEEKLELLF